MKLILLRTVIYILLLTGIAPIVQAQSIGVGDLLFTGVNTFDDNTDGNLQDDAFSFVMLRDCPANTLIYFTDLGWTGGGFQSTACATEGPRTDGMILWNSGPDVIKAGQPVVITCKYKLSALPGSVTGIYATKASGNKEYISLGLAGDQLFAFTGHPALATVIAGLNINRSAWDPLLDPCDFTSSKSMLPGTLTAAQIPNITAVNGRYNCNIAIANSMAKLQALILNTANWAMDNTMTAPAAVAFDLKKTAPCKLTIVQAGTGGILYVNSQAAAFGNGSSWNAPLPELRDALAAAADPANGVTQIWVAKGTYKPTNTIDPSQSFVIPANIAVYGGFAGNEATTASRDIANNPVILSGDIDNNDILTNGIVLKFADLRGANSYHVVTGNGSNIILDGVTVTGGQADGSMPADQSGAGLLINNSSTITIRNTRFYGNSSAVDGGAINIPSGASVSLINSSFYGNAAASGGAIKSLGNLTLTNVSIVNNKPTGVTCLNGQVTIQNSVLALNTSRDVQRAGAGNINYSYCAADRLYFGASAFAFLITDADFVNFASGDLRLSVTNPGINLGDPATNSSGYPLQVGNADLAGQTRISNTSIDLGAFEYQAQSQTVTFNPITAVTYGDNDITPGATSNQGSIISYTSNNTAVASIVAGKIKIAGAGTTQITATAAATNAFLAATASQTLTVNKKVITVTATDNARAYGAANPLFTGAYSAFAYSEDASVVRGTPTYSTLATLSSPVGRYDINPNVSGLSADNYSFTGAPGSLTITPVTQTINFTVPAEVTYGTPLTLTKQTDGNLDIVYAVSGPATVNGNIITLTGIGPVTINATQPGDVNHTAAALVTQSFTVKKAMLTVTANDKVRNYKQANPTPDHTITGFVNGENLTVISGTPDILITADVNSDAGAYPITIKKGSLSAANYDFSFTDGTLTINKLPQTITFPALTNKTYGDAPITLNATSDAGLPVSYTVGGPASITGNVLTITGAGNVTVTATQPGDVNYDAANPVPGSFTVLRAPLTLRADNKSREYGQNNPALTYSYAGFVNGDDASVVTVTGAINLSTTAILTSVPNTYPIAISANVSATNYIIAPVPGTLTVTIGQQSIFFPAVADKTYGDAAFTLNATTSSGLPVTYSVTSGPATISGNTVTITGSGTVSIAADQSGNSNYDPATRTVQTFQINKAYLTVVANDQVRAYKQPDPTLDYTITGYIGTDNNTVVSGQAATSTTADINSDAGTYPISVSKGNLSAANYDFRFTAGTLTITPTSQHITFAAIPNKQYGDAAFTPDASSDAGLPVTLAVTGGPATINGHTLTITGTGTVTVTATQNGDVNYNTATPVSQSFTVTKAPLQVKADDKQRIFGVANPTLTYTVTGFVYNDNSNAVSGAPALSTTANNTSVAGTYPIRLTIGNLSAANYTFTLADGTLTVGPADQSISFAAISDKTYGDAAFTLGTTASSNLPVSYSIVSGPAAINGNTVTLTGAGAVTIAANQAGNNEFKPAPQATRTFNVAKAALTVTAKNDTRTYNGTAYTGGNGADYTGFVNGDNTGRLTGAITYSGTAQGATDAGSYIITPAGLNSNDYTLTYVSGNLTITRAPQQITFTAPGNKNQGDTPFTLSATASSGLPVSFSSGNTQVITVNGNTATVGNAGAAVITASQAGNNNYEPATSVTQTIAVTAYQPPVVTAQGNTVFCQGGSVTLQSTVAPVYEWYRNNTLISGARSRTLTVTEDGSYMVKAIYPDNTGLTSTAIAVTVNPLPTGDLQVNGNTTISRGERITLVASGGTSYSWEPATGLSDATAAAPVARPAVTTTYRVIITSAAGCSVSKDVTITVKEDYKLGPNNILTPNGDGINDVWVVKNIDMYPQNEVKIFDRTGRLIYRQRGYTNNWNGTINGQRLAEGTYYYIIDLGDNKPLFKGFITIIHEN